MRHWTSKGDHAAAALRGALAIPHTEAGMTIGLFGGSFNPPHGGHRLVAETALKRLGLDRVWWIVSPGNPLKDHQNLRPIGERLDAVSRLANGPRHVVTAFEAANRIRYTADTLALLERRRPNVRFIWIMGADSLAGFDCWQDWLGIANRFPIAIIDRPGATLSVLSAKMAQRFSWARIRESDAASLPFRAPPAWVFLHGPRSGASSTLLRAD